jgi:DNA gyrase/topoisomerase IV subunit B
MLQVTIDDAIEADRMFSSFDGDDEPRRLHWKKMYGMPILMLK